jgi:hypothetical protein
MRPQKAQVKDKGFVVGSWDLLALGSRNFDIFVKFLGHPQKPSFGADWQAFHKVFQGL